MADRQPPPALAVSGLTVEFLMHGRWSSATSGVDFDIDPGECHALVGESGSGKSVSAMALGGLLPRNARVSGSAKLHGQELIGLPASRLRELRGTSIAYIFQEPMTALNPVYTVGRQIARAIRRTESISGERLRRRVIEMLQLVRMPHPQRLADHYPHQLSGGQRQRVMIAMALASKPGLLVADEPTTALDVTIQAEILQLLRQLQEDLSMALLMITHDMGVVADVADRVTVMQRGNVVETANVYTLFDAPAEPYTKALLDAVPRLGSSAPTSDAPRTSTANNDPSHQKETPPVLEVSCLKVTYGHGRRAFSAVNGVSFSVFDGDIVGLVGESGSGKSTIGRAIVGLAPISGGSVRVDGREVAGISQAELRRLRLQTGFVFQDPASSLNPRLPIGMAVVEAVRHHGIERGARQLEARAMGLLESVGIPTAWARRYPHELSGGQRQRVGIARAIALRPRLLIADEPTSALDVSVQARVLALLTELQSDLGFACVFISHDLAVVESLANRIIALNEGQVVEQGLASDLLRNPSQPYTRNLIAAAPIPDPRVQRRRRDELATAVVRNDAS